jgi:hypothetical protein
MLLLLLLEALLLLLLLIMVVMLPLQVLEWVLSYDGVNQPEPLAITAAAAALLVSGGAPCQPCTVRYGTVRYGTVVWYCMVRYRIVLLWATFHRLVMGCIAFWLCIAFSLIIVLHA